MRTAFESARAWRRGLALTIWLVALLLLCARSAAQTTRQASIDPLENQLIRRPTASDTPATAGVGPKIIAPRSNFLDIQRMAMALGIVLSLVFILRWVIKRFFPNVTGGRAAGVVRLLGRSPISARQNVLLVQVGRRVLVVADNGTQLSRLSEIKEADEVAWLIGRLTNREPANDEGFSSELSKAEDTFDQAGEPQPEEADDQVVASAHGEIEGLMQKVRGLARQIGKP